MIDWLKYPNFSKREFDCHETGDNDMQEEFMDFMQSVRTATGVTMNIENGSGFRAISHSEERDKERRGAHTFGMAADIPVTGLWSILLLLITAYLFGCRRMGVCQKGNRRFVHLDLCDRIDPKRFSSNKLWTY